MVDSPIVDAASAGSALGSGEIATIALALSRGALAVLDDWDARRVAIRRGVQLTGTIAVLVRLGQLGAIASITKRLDALEGIGFHATEELRAWALEAAGEQPETGR